MRAKRTAQIQLRLGHPLSDSLAVYEALKAGLLVLDPVFADALVSFPSFPEFQAMPKMLFRVLGGAGPDHRATGRGVI